MGPFTIPEEIMLINDDLRILLMTSSGMLHIAIMRMVTLQINVLPISHLFPGQYSTVKFQAASYSEKLTLKSQKHMASHTIRQ
jgi:hypothetical protein